MSRGKYLIDKDMSEEKKYDRNYKESSVKLALKIGINRATRSGTKAPYGTAGCKERRRLPLHRNVLETKYVLVCYNDIWYHVYPHSYDPKG